LAGPELVEKQGIACHSTCYVSGKNQEKIQEQKARATEISAPQVQYTLKYVRHERRREATANIRSKFRAAELPIIHTPKLLTPRSARILL